jgi:hypothetical protein
VESGLLPGRWWWVLGLPARLGAGGHLRRRDGFKYGRRGAGRTRRVERLYPPRWGGSATSYVFGCGHGSLQCLATHTVVRLCGHEDFPSCWLPAGFVGRQCPCRGCVRPPQRSIPSRRTDRAAQDLFGCVVGEGEALYVNIQHCGLLATLALQRSETGRAASTELLSPAGVRYSGMSRRYLLTANGRR